MKLEASFLSLVSTDSHLLNQKFKTKVKKGNLEKKIYDISKMISNEIFCVPSQWQKFVDVEMDNA